MKRNSKLRRMDVFSIAVLLICCLNTNKASAQEWDHEYVPFVEEGKVWNCVLVDNVLFEEPDYDCVFTMRGDTVIGERSYKKVFCKFEKHYRDKEQHYYCAVREDSYRVFFIGQDEKDEKLLYDFNSPQEKLILSRRDNLYERSTGEHMFLRPKGLFTFDIYGIIEIDEVQKRENVGLWIEGVGSYGNPFEFAPEFYCKEPTLGDIMYVTSCEKDNEFIFEEWWMDTNYNPLTQRITTIKSTSHNIYYDLQGHPVKGMPKRGVYVKDGRKIVK